MEVTNLNQININGVKIMVNPFSMRIDVGEHVTRRKI